MADTATTTNELKIEVLFVDADTRTFNLKNPKSTVSQSDIANLNTYMQDTGILIGDKYGGAFGKITSAKRIAKQTVNLDLTAGD